ncbi:MAG TPA: restriction endonuclease subunit M [Bacteroidales bacterium]|nr:restriction endonuclease subunit M [Bacteroidales bacterium]
MITEESVFQRHIKRGAEKGIISFSDEQAKITYKCKRNYSTSFKNPEETIRAAYFVELVLDYSYPQKRIDMEVTVPRRTPEDRADIVVYEDDECMNTFLVVECKRDGITDAQFKQAIEQAFGNANSLRSKYASVVAGNTRTAFDIARFKPSERDKNVIADIPKKYGEAPKYKFIKGDKERDLKVVSRDELIKALKKCHDTVWEGGKRAPTDAFDEVSKLLFCKLRDEKYKVNGDIYDFQIGTKETIEEVYKRVNTIYQKAKREDEDVFREDIRVEPAIVYAVVEHLQELAINKIDLDAKGIAFERFMQDFFIGKMGQFFTPRNIVDFAVKMMNPKFHQKVIDPACGSGGFLLHVLDYLRTNAENNYDSIEAQRLWHEFALRRLYGIEINDQIARVCKMNMIIHDDGHTNIIGADSLENFSYIQSIRKDFKASEFDLLLTNPPFGAMVKSTEKDYLKNYELGRISGRERNNQKTEILFIERCVNFVKPEMGRIAIVLPDGILTNSSLQYVRDYIMEHTQILAVVSLPQTAFTHYGAGVKSSLVFLRRKGQNEKLGNYRIFMAIADYIGYDATGRDIPQNDLPEILKRYREFEEGL